MCVAVDEDGNVLASRDPSGGASAWHATHLQNDRFTGISCPSTTLCVASVVDGFRDQLPSDFLELWQVIESSRQGRA